MKTRIASLLLLLTTVLIVMFPTAHAYMVKQTQPITNVIAPAQVSCKVIEVGFDEVTKSSVVIQNTSNISAYIRLRVVTYWQDSKGNAVARNAPSVTINFNSQDWIKDEGNNTYYCKTEVTAGEKTPEFLSSPVTLQPVVEESSDSGVKYVYYPVVEIIAEAIQSKSTSAVTSAWKVSIDSNNNISSIN